MKLAAIVVLVVVYALALYGWGRVAERLARVRWPWPLTICLGLVVWIFLGGIANALAVTHAAVLDIIVLLGLVAAAIAIGGAAGPGAIGASDGGRRATSFLLRVYPTAALIVAVFVFTALTQVPPDVVNVHDDLEKYLSHPARMLATGTLDGGPFGALGAENLGGQAFLHGFVAAHWPISSVNAVDALFGLALAMTVVLVVADRARLSAWFAPLAVASLILIDPQYVNVSAIYTGVALLLFLYFLPTGESARSDPALFGPSGAVVVGLIYAALVALKPTFLLVALVHYLLSVDAAAWTMRRPRRVLVWGATVAAASLGGLLPWVIVHVPGWRLAFAAQGPLPTADADWSPAPPFDLFSAAPLHFGMGTSFAHYTAVALLVAVWCLYMLTGACRRNPSDDAATSWRLACCAVLPILYFGGALSVGRYLTGYGDLLRYICPVFIATLPAAIVAMGQAFTGRAPGEGADEGSRPSRALLAIALPAIALSLVFVEPLVNRVKQAVSHGSVLSFPGAYQDQAYLAYSRFALGGAAADEVSRLQHMVPEGETLVAWISLPVYLDFGRNRIFDVQPAGLGSRLDGSSLLRETETLVDFFRRHDIGYLLWQRRGAAVRSDGQLWLLSVSPFAYPRRNGRSTLAFNRTLDELSKRSQVLFDDGTYILLRF